MSKKEKHGTVPATMGQIKDITSALVQAMPTNLTSQDAQKIISQKGRLGKDLRKIFQKIVGTNDYAETLAEWTHFYKEVFRLEFDFSNLALLEKKDGFNWLLVMASGLTANKIFFKCAEKFQCWKYIDDLNTVTSVRKTDKTYTIWLRDRVEADEENKNLSANDCQQQNINGITLEERMLLELWYYWKTSKHLDINNITLCSGSRDSDGHVRSVSWDDDGMCVDYCSPGYSYDDLRSRSAVSV